MRKPEFIAQESAGNCGAAALSMVLGQFDWNEPPQKIASLLTIIAPNGMPTIKTHQLANHARSLGFSCMVVQFAEHVRALARCHEAGFGVIINHRLEKDKPTGHFSVLSGLNLADGLIGLHDPQRGPDIWTPLVDLLELWSPLAGGSQIAGSVGVVIGPRPVGGVPGVCPACSQDFDEKAPVKCAGCSVVMEPMPGFTIGCLAEGCPGRLWRRLFCPHCDRTWSGQVLARRKETPAILPEIPPDEPPADPSGQLDGSAGVTADEDQSTRRLAEALLAIPLPDWGLIAALAESQKQVLLELAEGSDLARDLRDRAEEWGTAADEVRQDSARLAASRESLSAELQAASDALKTDAGPALPATAPAEEPADEVPAAAPVPKPELPSGAQLVARLMALAKQRG